MRSSTGNTLSRVCLIGSVAALGYALEIHDGFYDDRALVWLTAALALCGAGVFTLRRSCLALSGDTPSPPFVDGARVIRFIAALAIAGQIALLLRFPPGMYLQARANLNLFRAGIVLQAALAGFGVIAGGKRAALWSDGMKKLARAWFPALLTVHVALGIWMLRASPSPRIDVVVVHREALQALAHGQSPYAITFENIYGAGSGFYNSQAVAGNRVMFGYPYPPLNLLLAAPGHWIAGDYRYVQLAAWIIGAGLVGFAQPGVVAKLAATLLLTQPRGFFVLEQGWTEPIALLMLALTVYAMIRRPALASWAGGLLVASKQYLVIAAVLLLRFATGHWNGTAFVLRALAIAMIVTVPFILWNPRAFFESVVFLQMREPFRIDSLSYLSWAARHGWGAGSFLWAMAAAVLTVALTSMVTPNTPAGFAAALALSTFSTFAFGSKAFCNYYFFIVGAMCCALAAQVDNRSA
jgi:hypothetical protein